MVVIYKIYYIFLLLFFFNINSNYFTTYIVNAIAKDKKFLQRYGEIGKLLLIKMQAWMNVISNNSVTPKELEILLNMYIPEKKKFFSSLEKILLRVKFINNKEIKRRYKVKSAQLLCQLFKNNKRFYSSETIVWHIQKLSNYEKFADKIKIQDNLSLLVHDKDESIINDELTLNKNLSVIFIMDEKNNLNFIANKRLKEELFIFLDKKVLLKKYQKKIYKCKGVISHNPYHLLLRNLNKPEKIKKILENYKYTGEFSNLCHYIQDAKITNEKPGNLINKYLLNRKKSKGANINIEEFYGLFIILIIYIQKVHRKKIVSQEQYDKILDFLLHHQYFVTKNFNGIGVTNYLLTITILSRKLMHHMETDKKQQHLNKIKFLVTHVINNNFLYINGCISEISTPYLPVYLTNDFISHFEKKNYLENKNFYNLYKNKNKKKIIQSEFFIMIGLNSLLLKDFKNSLTLFKTAFIFAYKMSKELEEYIVFLIIFTLMNKIKIIKNKLLIHKDDKEKSNILQNRINNIYKKIQYWVNIIKNIGQTTIYGQIICDIFANKYRKTNALVVYCNNFYNSIYKDTLKRTIAFEERNINNNNNSNRHISKYDWIILMCIYVLQNEQKDINIEIIRDDKGKQQYSIYNNKYSITSLINYQLDYLIKLLNKKTLSTPTILMKEFIKSGFKKYKYMLMIGEAIENKTGCINSLTIHPMTDIIKAYQQDTEFDYKILSPIMQIESYFVMQMDNKHVNSFTPFPLEWGSGLFQLNRRSAMNSASYLKIAFNSLRLMEDISYNFMLVVSFLKNVQKYLNNKHIIAFIIGYNGGYNRILQWQKSLQYYDIPLDDPLFITISPCLIHTGITRRYVFKLLSNYNKSIFWQSENYYNIILNDKRLVK